MTHCNGLMETWWKTGLETLFLGRKETAVKIHKAVTPDLRWSFKDFSGSP